MAATTARGAAIGYTGHNRSIITLAETNQLKTSPGKVSHITVWSVGVGATISLYDDADSNDSQVFEWVTADGKGTFALQCPMSAGIRVVSTGGTPAKFNVVWS